MAGLPHRDRAPRRSCPLLLAKAGCPSRPSARDSAASPAPLPSPALPAFSLEKFNAVLPDALPFALLGGIESLLSAVVADGMTGRRHRSNCELVAQGVANIASALFGGICATGTIARTATNVRAGARRPDCGHAPRDLPARADAGGGAAGVLHPAGALAAVLAVVAWNMAEKA